MARKRQRRVHGQPKLTSATHSCIDAALVNAVDAVSGEDAARQVREIVERDNPLRRSLLPLSVLLDRATEKIVPCRLLLDEKLQRTIQRPGRRL